MGKREQCCSAGCRHASVIVFKVYTSERPEFFAFCPRHFKKMGAVIDAIVAAWPKGRVSG